MRIGQERGCPPKPNGNSRPAEDSKARNLSGELCFSHGEITRPIPGKANFPGEQLGFEYEVAKEFAKSLGVRLEIVIPPSREALLEYLATGKGDLIAAGMTRTAEREKSFSSPEEGVRALIDAGKKMTQKRFSKFSVPRLNPLSKPATRFPIGKPASASINLTMRQTSW